MQRFDEVVDRTALQEIKKGDHAEVDDGDYEDVPMRSDNLGDSLSGYGPLMNGQAKHQSPALPQGHVSKRLGTDSLPRTQSNEREYE